MIAAFAAAAADCGAKVCPKTGPHEGASNTEKALLTSICVRVCDVAYHTIQSKLLFSEVLVLILHYSPLSSPSAVGVFATVNGRVKVVE